MEKQKTDGGAPAYAEVVDQPLIDTITVATGAIGAIPFFRDVSSKSRYQTNMNTGGQLPQGQSFEIHGIEVKILTPAVKVADMENLFLTCKPYLTLTIENKVKFEIPLDEIPSGNQIHRVPDQASAGTSTFAENGFQSIANQYHFKKAYTIGSLQSFDVTITLGSAVTLTASLDVRVKLLGILTRPVR